MNIRSFLEKRLGAVLSAAAGQKFPAMISPSVRPEFGDYQANGVMAAAKALKTNPRKLAEQVLASAGLDDVAEKLEIAGPGFINIRLHPDWMARQLEAIRQDERLGVDKPPAAQRVVVDYCGPNLAKEMHVGHLRSTIIGDAMARVLDFVGHTVIRQNHVGDWGTQFGMLLAYMDRLAGADAAEEGKLELSDLEGFYRQAKKLFDEDPQFAETARQYVVKLQGGDAHCLKNWKAYLDASLSHCDKICATLGVQLTRQDVRGESSYNDDLPRVIEALGQAGLLKESQGARCVFLSEFADKDGNIAPVIVQKSDGGYLYATTDLAAIRYRVGQLNAQRILYVVDARQSLQLRQSFAVARAAHFAPAQVSLEHISFGTMLGKDNKPFKTREGGTVKLLDLLDEAQKRAHAVVLAKNPEQAGSDQAQEVSRIVGIGAVKYADLSQNRTSDYVFSFEKMLALEGNTAPYMQYAYARIRSMYRKGGIDEKTLSSLPVRLADPAERKLAIKLLQFPEIVQTVATESLPNLLCGYLYELAGAFTGFYENCPVLQSDEPTRSSRLALCALTARTIQTGLGLLGIRTVEQM